jgi:hypothetical protein
LEEAVINAFEDICKTENIVINWKAFPEVQEPGDFVESSRILLWDKAFPTFIGKSADKPFDKKSIFAKFPGTAQVVKRVTYRYDTFLLIRFKFHNEVSLSL